MPFLTLQDPNARIKGSRDPLGVVPIWARFGRRIVGNLTTSSTSVRGFTTLLLARYLAEHLIAEGSAKAEDALDIFLRTEQICAHVRHAAHGASGEVRGIERVRAMGGAKKTVPIHLRDGAILSDQKTYGLWGLYSVPSRTSGLIPEGPIGVTARAREMIEAVMLPALDAARSRLERLVRRGGTLKLDKTDPVFHALTPLLGPTFVDGERQLYESALRDGDGIAELPEGRQRRMRAALEAADLLDKDLGRAEMTTLAETARDLDEGLAAALADIVTIEAFLAPAAALFEHLLACAGKRPATIASDLAERWGARLPGLDTSAFAQLAPRIAQVTGAEVAAEIQTCHGALADGEYVAAIEALLRWNARVMADRKAGPWARMAPNQTVEVLYRIVEHELPTAGDLPDLWRHSYFVAPLQSVTRELARA
jgi:hypothetical protein